MVLTYTGSPERVRPGGLEISVGNAALEDGNVELEDGNSGEPEDLAAIVVVAVALVAIVSLTAGRSGPNIIWYAFPAFTFPRRSCGVSSPSAIGIYPDTS